jgi:protein TonB
VSIEDLKRTLTLGLLFAVVALAPQVWAQGEITRKVKTKIAPEYPQLARQMHIAGMVKIQVTVAANGTIKNTRVVGGHPLLVNAALDAIKKWRFETSSEETTGILEFHFDPGP